MTPEPVILTPADAIIRRGLEALAESLRQSLGTSSLASLWDQVQVMDRLDALKLIAMQASLALSLLLGGVILFTVILRRTLEAPAADAAPTAAAVPVESAAPTTGVLRDKWNAVVAHLDSAREADWKVAVIEADKLAEDALFRAGFPGATFGDRLSNITPGTLASLDGLWWAHKVRNRLAHEVDYFLRYTEARQAVGYFEAALTELQLI